MSSIPFTCFGPVDSQGRARRRALQRRMRIASLCVLATTAMLLFTVAQAYLQGGLLLAAGLLVAGTLLLFEAFRRADRAFLAPLQAICQDDYSRELDVLLRHFLAAENQPSGERARRIDA